MSRRVRTLSTIYDAMWWVAHRDGTTLATDQGAALWKRPSHLDFSPLEVLRSGLWTVAFTTTPAVLRRYAVHEAAAMARVQPWLRADTGYLTAIVVEPSLQGQGHGGRLLEATLDAMRAQFSHCVLRTEQPRNVPFYERHGFSLMDQFTVTVSGLPVWVYSRPLR